MRISGGEHSDWPPRKPSSELTARPATRDRTEEPRPFCPPSTYYRPADKPKSPRDPSKPEFDSDAWVGRVGTGVKFGLLAVMAGFSVYKSGAVDGLFEWGEEPSAEITTDADEEGMPLLINE